MIVREAERIVARAEDRYGLDRGELAGRSRLGRVVRVRALAVWAVWQGTLEVRARRDSRFGLSFSQIGKVMGGRDHSTIIHLLRKAEILIARAAKVRAEAEALRGTEPLVPILPLPRSVIALIPKRVPGPRAGSVEAEAGLFLQRRKPLRDVVMPPGEGGLMPIAVGSIRLRRALLGQGLAA